MQKATLTRRRLAGVFLLGLCLFYSPVLVLFDRAERWHGFPTIYVYLFGVWLLVILLAALIVERPGR